MDEYYVYLVWNVCNSYYILFGSGFGNSGNVFFLVVNLCNCFIRFIEVVELIGNV